MEPDKGGDVHPPMRRLNPTVLLLIAGLVILVGLIAYFRTNRNSDQDKLSGKEVASTQPAAQEKRCASQATYDLVKRELFRRAAQMRGSDQAAYDSIANSAVVRMENPVLESEDKSTGAANCSGSLSIDLPPGLRVVGGRTTLMSDVDYTVEPAADGGGTVVLLRNADAIIAPLATLERVAPQAQPPASEEPNQAQPTTDADNGPPATPPSSQAPPSPSAPSTTGPRASFDCNRARTSGESAVCSDPGLAALDRNMAAQYARAIAEASPEQRDLLRDTARRFYAYRDRCSDARCIGAAYVGRMREIRDIMEGRWEPPR